MALTIEEARKIAESEAKKYFSKLVEGQPKAWLSDRTLSEKNCWLFLKSPDLKFREDAASWSDMAIVVSKRGTVLTVADHQEDEAALKAYLHQVSDYLGKRNE